MAVKRRVIKIGSSLLIGPDGDLRRTWLTSLAADLRTCRNRGQEVIVVTSGAIALGRADLGLGTRALRLEEKQAAAAVGQIGLARAFQTALADAGLATGQVLLTLDDTESRRRYLNARATIEALLRLGVVPVVNENDTVATAEIRFGDNDRLSARVAVMAVADQLLLLSDVDGLYTKNPRLFPDATLISEVERITLEIEGAAGAAGTVLGTGGMVSKLQAAKIATRSGCEVVIARGTADHPLDRLDAGGVCTRFRPQGSPRQARKDWIAGSLTAVGVIRIDAGAARALRAGKSLLPAGVVAIEGTFERGDPVLVVAPDRHEIAKGLSAYDALEAIRLIGRRTVEIQALLGYAGREELIHRDDLVLL